MSTTNLITILLLLVGLLYLLIIGTIVRKKRTGEGIVKLLLAYVVLSLLWTVGLGLDAYNVLPINGILQFTLYGLLLMTLIYVQLTRAILLFTKLSWFWWLLGLVWIGLVIALSENLMPLSGALSGVSPQELGDFAATVGWVLAMIGVMLLTLLAYAKTQEPLHKNRIRYWGLSVVVTVGTGVFFFTSYAPLAIGFQLASILFSTYIVITYNLPDMRQTARRVTSYLIITVLTVAIYLAGFLLVNYAFQSLPNYNPIWAGATVALVLAIIFDPLVKLVQRGVNRIISGSSYDSTGIVREYSANVSNILELDKLANVTLTFLNKEIGIRRSILFVVNRQVLTGNNGNSGGMEVFQLRGVSGVGDRLPSPEVLADGQLSITGPVGQYLGQEDQPLTQYDIDMHPRFQSNPANEMDWLTALKMVVYVPIHIERLWIGLLAFGPKTSGDRYFESDLTLLRTLADQTAVALENARLFDDLKARNIKIEHLNTDLAEANRKLTLLDQAKSDFIGVASHELRTPLTQVRGFNDILNDMAATGDLTPETAVQMTESIRKSATRLQSIVDTMFDVSQIDTATLDLNASPNSLASIIGMIAEELADALQDRQQTLTVKPLDNLPSITADGQRLKQIFSNLIQNGIKYTPDGGQITVSGQLLDVDKPPEEQSIEVVIADTGIGIDAEDLDRLFEKFYRVGDVSLHSTGATKFKGAGPGLGLTVARGLVEAHGGRIWAESPGHNEETCPGSSFHVVLPVNPGPLTVG